MFNLRRNFERRFTPTDAGYLYFPFRRSGGHFLTETEFESLRDQYARAFGFWGAVKIGAIWFAIITVCIVGLALTGSQSDNVGSVLGYVMSAGILAYFMWIYSSPYRLIRGRVPSVPMRTEKRYQSEMAARVPNWRFVIPIIFIPLMLWLGFSMAIKGSWWSAAPLLLAIIATYSWGRVAITKLSERERS